MKNALREYLYVDLRRLDSYFHQISSPVTYDKVPTWKVGLSLAGPIGEGTQSRLGRPFTLHEKINSVMEYLISNNMMSEGGMSDESRWRDDRRFCLETISAQKVLIPPLPKPGMELPAIAFWYATSRSVYPDACEDGDIGTRYLYLIEDSKREDTDLTAHYSAGSALHLLAGNLGEQVDEQFGLPKSNWADHPASVPVEQRFTRNPHAFFESIGARVLPAREITAMYRLRGSCNPRWAEQRDVALVGYVVAAWEANY